MYYIELFTLFKTYLNSNQNIPKQEHTQSNTLQFHEINSNCYIAVDNIFLKFKFTHKPS